MEKSAFICVHLWLGIESCEQLQIAKISRKGAKTQSLPAAFSFAFSREINFGNGKEIHIMNQSKTVETMDSEMARVLIAKPEAERLGVAWGMWRSARTMLARMLASEHPDWTTDQVQTDVARMMTDGT